MQNARFFCKKSGLSGQKPLRWTPYVYPHIYMKSEWLFLIDSHKEEEETEEVDMEMKQSFQLFMLTVDLIAQKSY